MCNQSNIASLKTLSIDLLNDALKEIRSHREKTEPPNDKYFIIAEYLLLEAEEYVEGAWEMMSLGRYNASIALSRWFLEASLNLFWAISDKDEIEDKLKVLAGEALRCDANLREGMAELWPDHAEAFKRSAEEARQVRKSLGVDRPENLENRLNNIKQENHSKYRWLYPLYRICCSSAHPSLKVWERFAYSGNSVVSQESVDKRDTACWMVAASTFYLVISSYCLTDLGDIEQLKDWWEKKVRTLLNKGP